MKTGFVVLAVALLGCSDPDRARPVAVAEPAKTASLETAPPPPAPPPPAAAATTTPSKIAATPATTAPEGSLAVKRLVITRAVKDREPVDDTAFRGNGKVYAFVEVENHGSAPGEVFVEFQPPGGEPAHGNVALAVGAAPRWRTWAYTRTATTPGTWTVTVRTKKGAVLALATFDVVA